MWRGIAVGADGHAALRDADGTAATRGGDVSLAGRGFRERLACARRGMLTRVQFGRSGGATESWIGGLPDLSVVMVSARWTKL